MKKKAFLSFGLLVVAIIGFETFIHNRGHSMSQNELVQEPSKKSSPEYPRYRVVSSDGAHLIVTDNTTEKLFFYAIDHDAKIGSELKLRAEINLKDVGKASLLPTMTKLTTANPAAPK